MSISLHDEFAILNLYIKYEPRTIYEKVSYSKINPEYKDVDGNKFSETHKELIAFIDKLPYDKPNIDIIEKSNSNYMGFVTNKNIKKGDEITINYNNYD